jgi:PKHD-type hydroxylase
MYGSVFRSGEETGTDDFTPEFCQAIIKLADNLTEQEALVNHGKKIEQIRNNSMFGIDDPNFMQTVLYSVLAANLQQGWNFDIQGVQPLQLSKYTVGEKYSWHMDYDHKEQARKLTFNVVLNDDYEGGEFQFSWGSPSAPYRKRVIKEEAMKTPGRIVVFPSYYYHRVTPVTKGVRYSLTGWAYGPAFK